jgi:uncharacterized membrane protein (DUF106 family)
MEPWLIAITVITCIIVFMWLVWIIGWHFYGSDFATSMTYLVLETLWLIAQIASA